MSVEKKNLNNAMEQALIPEVNNQAIDAQTVLMAGLVEMMGQKSEVIKEYLSDSRYKTEITESQRKLLPTMVFFANVPYPSLLEHTIARMLRLKKTDKQIKAKCAELLEEFKLDVVINFVDDFLSLGIAVKRKGRKEDGDAIGAFMDENIEVINRQPPQR
jgi:hypothetical protein